MSAEGDRARAHVRATSSLTGLDDITGIVIVTRHLDGSFQLSSRAKAPAEDLDADRMLRLQAIEAIREVT